MNFYSKGQTEIKGKVISVQKLPISNVAVTAISYADGHILAFCITDRNGFFSLSITTSEDSLQVKASHLSYTKHIMVVPNRKAVCDITLYETSVKLKEVVVKNSAVRQHKDTITYDIQKFANKEDRSVADVVRKMPGFEVQNDGTIYYQGKPIQAFLVDGLDLLEGKYSLASNNLAYEAVRNVQVIENDQRIKVLDSLVASDKTTVNLQLKKYLTITKANVGIGMSPVNRDIGIIPITYKKNYQAINSFQSNNSGIDYAMQLRVLTSEAVFSDNFKRPLTNLLSTQQLANPPFDQQYWLNNNLNMLSSDILGVLKKGLQVKMNISYVNDFQQRHGNTNTVLFTGTQNIQISELKTNLFNRNYIKSGFVLEYNERNLFYKNVLTVEREWASTFSGIVSNISPIHEGLSTNPFSISNRLSLIRPIGKRLLHINSVTSYSSLWQGLNVAPGQFDSILNNGKSFDLITQVVKVQSILTNNFLGWVQGLGRFTIAPKVAIEWQSDYLGSDVSIVESQVTKQLGLAFKNDLKMSRFKFYQEVTTQYKSGTSVALLALRISQQHNQIAQSKSMISSQNKVFFEPKFELRGKLFGKYETSIFSAIRYDFGELSQLYNAYILQTYRTLQRFNSDLPENNNISAGLRITYKEPLKGWFYNFSATINRIKRNLIFTNTIGTDGATTLSSLSKDNIQQNANLTGGVNKYLAPIKTIVKLSGRYMSGTFEQVINSTPVTVKGEVRNVMLGLNNSYFKIVSLDYEANFSFSKNRLDDISISHIRWQQHKAKINVFPYHGHMITIIAQIYSNSQLSEANNTFLNFLYRFSIEKKKIDFEIGCNNILNSRYFTVAHADGFTTISNSFQMRERQLMFSSKFTF